MDGEFRDYGVIAGNVVDANSGASKILGDLSSFSAVSGSGTITVTRQYNIGALNTSAQSQYTYFMSLSPDTTSSAADITGQTFNPGINLLTNAGITITNGTVTLSGSGLYVFQLPNGGLTTTTTTNPVFFNLSNGAKASSVYWMIASDVNIQTQNGNITTFSGSIISQGNITLGTACTSAGSLAASTASGVITLNTNVITSQITQRTLDTLPDDYLIFETTLADSAAIQINAANANGGIAISAGFGGIAVNTTNSITLSAAAASNFTTTSGNLTLDATTGLVDIDAGSGLNIGIGSTTTPIYIGTSSYTKDIEIGNNSGGTQVDIRGGTGGITLNSAATTSTAIDVFSSGGFDLNATGIIDLVSGNNTLGAVTLDTSSNGGGILLTSGAQGIYLSSNGGVIALGSFSGGDIYIGTAALARTITIGNTTSTTALDLSAGTGGIAIGNDTSTGEIQIGNVASDKTIILGNNNTNSRTFNRFGTAGVVGHQESETALSDADATLTIAELLTDIFTITPTTGRTLTLPTAALAVAGISGVQVNDSIDFNIINESTPANEAHLTIVAGTGGSITGNSDIAPTSNSLATFYTAGTGAFRMRFTNVTGGTEAYIAYRIF